MNETELSILKDVVDDIKENADEINKFGSEYERGQLLAYASVLSIIKTHYLDDAEKLGLDFDIDKKYLLK